MKKNIQFIEHNSLESFTDDVKINVLFCISISIKKACIRIHYIIYKVMHPLNKFQEKAILGPLDPL